MTTTENDSRTPDNTLTRRKMLQAAAITSSAAIAAVILPGPHSRAADSHPARELIDELIAAISAETAAFSTAPHDDEGQVITDAAIAGVMVAKDALLAIPKRELLEDSRMLFSSAAGWSWKGITRANINGTNA